LLKGDVATLESLYRSSGFRQVKIQTKVDDNYQGSDHKLAVHIHIDEGVRTIVGRLQVLGVQKVVLSDLPETVTQPGQPYSEQDLLSTQTRLYDLGIFSQVDTAVQNPEGTDPQKNVLVQLQEAKRYTFTYGLGLEFQTGQPAGTTAPQGTTGVSPRVEFDVTRLNVGGRNQSLACQSHVGRLQQRGLISYSVHKLLDSDKGLRIY